MIKAREATILLSAKIAGPEDTLTTYKSYLSRPIQPPGRNSKSSKVLGVAEVSINQHKWIDGYHLGSELQTWNSRYLATTKDGLAILISFSNHSAKSKEYKPIFARIVSSLRVNLQSSVKESLSKIQKPINAPTTMPSPTAPSEDLEALKGTESLAQNPMVIYLGIALIIVTILALLFFPKKKKNKL
ncbi:MAG: hypothetical protein KDD61_11865 [Bdellovibrionales bacterium]|nr:hypothetical protein [Bdellovibrionales bacterium]